MTGIRSGLTIILCWGAYRLLRAAARVSRQHAYVTAMQGAGKVMQAQLLEELRRRRAA